MTLIIQIQWFANQHGALEHVAHQRVPVGIWPFWEYDECTNLFAFELSQNRVYQRPWWVDIRGSLSLPVLLHRINACRLGISRLLTYRGN